LEGYGGGRERTVIERQVNYLTRLVDDLLLDGLPGQSVLPLQKSVA
jgi:hypothetical protein